MYTGAFTMKSYLILFLSFAVPIFLGTTTRQPLKETPFNFTIVEGGGGRARLTNICPKIPISVTI